MQPLQYIRGKGRQTLLVLHELHPSKEACDDAIGFGDGLRETFEQLDQLRGVPGAAPGARDHAGFVAGELVHVLSSLERRSERWGSDPESARAALSAAISLVLGLLGRDPDPAKSREHVLLSVLAERRLLRGQSADLGALLEDLAGGHAEPDGSGLPRDE